MFRTIESNITIPSEVHQIFQDQRDCFVISGGADKDISESDIYNMLTDYSSIGDSDCESRAQDSDSESSDEDEKAKSKIDTRRLIDQMSEDDFKNLITHYTQGVYANLRNVKGLNSIGTKEFLDRLKENNPDIQRRLNRTVRDIRGLDNTGVMSGGRSTQCVKEAVHQLGLIHSLRRSMTGKSWCSTLEMQTQTYPE